MPQSVRSGNAPYILLIHPEFINETKDTAKSQWMQKKRCEMSGKLFFAAQNLNSRSEQLSSSRISRRKTLTDEERQLNLFLMEVDA